MYIVDYIDLIKSEEDIDPQKSQEVYEMCKQLFKDTERQIKAEKAYLEMHEKLEEYKREEKSKIKI